MEQRYKPKKRNSLRFRVLGFCVLGSWASYLSCNAIDSGSAVILKESEGEGTALTADFTLVDQNGVIRTGKDLLGKVSLIYFGYTYCPVICPMAMSAIGDALQLLGHQASQVQPVFITLDPERDTPEVIKTYVQAFNPNFWGLRGDQKAIQEAQENFKVYAQVLPKRAEKDYDLNHSSLIYIFDANGQLHTVQPNSVFPSDLAHTIEKILL